MRTLIITTAIGLTMLAAPLAAEDDTAAGGAAPTPDYMSQSQGMLPAADRARSYDNTDPATVDPQFGPQGGGDSAGAEAGADGESGAGEGGSGAGAAGSGGAGS